MARALPWLAGVFATGALLLWLLAPRAAIDRHAPPPSAPAATEALPVEVVLAPVVAADERVAVMEPEVDTDALIAEMRRAEKSRFMDAETRASMTTAEYLADLQFVAQSPIAPTPTVVPWAQAKLAIRFEFELTHERDEQFRNEVFDLERTPTPDGARFEYRLDLRERSASRIAGIAGSYIGVEPLSPAAAARAIDIVASHRDRIAPLVEAAVDLYEQALMDTWRNDLCPIWRDGEPHPESRDPEPTSRLSSEGFGGGDSGWNFAFEFYTSDHPALEAALAEIEALKTACIEELAALGQ